MAKLPITISHPDKIFWPADGYTKLDLAEYYAAIFSKLQPYVDDRILSLERCPDGMRGKCFYQKEKPQSMPPGTPTKRIRHAGGSSESTNYVVGGSLQTQLALVNLGCIAVHVMAGRATAPRKSDWLCFDLDPATGKFADAARAALHVKDGLDALKLDSYAKTSGSRGIHVFVPLRGGPDADEVLAFARAFVARVSSVAPQGTHGRTFDLCAWPARLSGRVPQRIWPDGSSSLFRSPPRQSAFFHAIGLAGSENQP